MRLLSVIVVAFSLAVLLTAWFVRGRSAPDVWSFQSTSPEIHVTGSRNTLASLAASLNDPGRLDYDAKTRTAISHASLIIDGELQMGEADRPEAGENLQMATQVCGDLRIEVRPTGKLRLYHSTLSTVSQILTQNACSRGYALFVDGNLTMEDSRISYISGSSSQVLRADASAVLRGSSFSYCDGCALSCVGVDGGRITIENCTIRGSGNWGLLLSGTRERPLEIRDSVLDASAAAVLVADREGRLRLIDCILDEGKIAFSQPGGEIAFAWTRRFRVTDANGRPRAGVTLVARATSGGMPGQTVETKTDERGIGELVLTEWISRPGALRRGPENTLSPYELTVVIKPATDREADSGGLRTERRRCEVHGKDLSTLEIVVP